MNEKHGKAKDAIDKLQNSVNKVVGVICVMQNIIKGLDTPCGLCVGCPMEDDHLGVCGSFVLKGDL